MKVAFVAALTTAVVLSNPSLAVAQGQIIQITAAFLASLSGDGKIAVGTPSWIGTLP